LTAKSILLLIPAFDRFSLSLKSTFCLPSGADPDAWKIQKGVLRNFGGRHSPMAADWKKFIKGVFSHA
jgi:hypothetical protein